MSIHTTIVSSSQIEEFQKLLGARALDGCLTPSGYNNEQISRNNG